MPDFDWRPVQPARGSALRDARLQTHHAAQLATALGISFLPKRDDDSHTNLEWLPHLDALASNAVSAGTTQLRVAVDVTALALLVLHNDHVVARQPLHGRTIEQVASWLRDQLASAGLTAGSLTLRRHYEIPDHPVAHGRTFDASARDLFDELARWFHDGATALEAIRASHPTASSVRCWPHHFDVGLVIDAGAGKSVGAGLEPGDVYYDEPYFYVNMHPAPPASALTAPLRGGGQWHTHEWIGAVLPASRISDDGAQQQTQVKEFLDSAI